MKKEKWLAISLNITLDTGIIVFGVNDIMKALEMSALEKILLYEDIDITRYEIKNPVKGDTKIWYLSWDGRLPEIEKLKVGGGARKKVGTVGLLIGQITKDFSRLSIFFIFLSIYKYYILI